jgi:nicotinate-nucleotide--dimethylbenzimidazole phosphoribosyltransferase
MYLDDPLGPAPALHAEAMRDARARWASRAKPPGSLGRLEDLAVHLSGVAGQCPPPEPCRPAVIVFAADHGVVADGASAWPAEVTAAMLTAIAQGGAAISAFAAAVGAETTIVDVGVATPVHPLPGVRDARIRKGTASIAREAAMSSDEARAAVAEGRRVAAELATAGADCLIGGEMGIGNTTPAAALIAAVTGRDAAEVTGPGAGAPPGGLGHKRELVAAALARYGDRPNPGDGAEGGFHLLAELGGLEIGALAGLYVEAAQRHVPFVVDGMIALSALCVADALAPGTAAHAIAGHRSVEPGAGIALGHLGLTPLLDLDLRLGEGTGACLAFPLLRAAIRALTTMHDLPGAS